MFCTEVEHFLGFRDAANVGSGEDFSAADERTEAQWLLLWWQTDNSHDTVWLEKAQVLVDWDGCANGVEDEVEFTGVFGEEILIRSRKRASCAEFLGKFSLAQGTGQNGNVSALGCGDLDTHVAEPAEAHDCYFVAFFNVPAGDRGVGGDACAQQWCCDIEVEFLWDAAEETFVDHYLFGVATLRDGAVDVVGVVGSDVSAKAVVFKSCDALFAFAAGVNEAADTNAVADFPLGYACSNGRDHTCDFVAYCEWEMCLTPFIADGVDIAVADARSFDINNHIICAWVTAFNDLDLERCVGAGFLKCFYWDTHPRHGTDFLRSEKIKKQNINEIRVVHMLELNRIIQEIEDDLEVDVDKLARRALTTEYHLRKMFGTLAGMSLAEYIRNRRLTRAAADLKAGQAVLDVAVKYGYASSEAFARAFRRFHAVNPSQARSDSIMLSSQPRLRFHIHVKGVTDLRYRIIEKEAFYLTGFHTQVQLVFKGDNQGIVDFEKSLGKEAKARLLSLNDIEPKGALSISDEIENQQAEGSTLDYWHAVATSNPVEEFESMEVPAGTWVMFESEGAFPESIQQMWADAATEWFPANPYSWAPGPQLLHTEYSEDFSTASAQLWLPITRNS